MPKDIYVSSDELERWEAGAFDYDLCQHPCEVKLSALSVGQWLVLAFDYILFGDKAATLALARAAAERGLWVGIHAFDTLDPQLIPLRGKPNVVVDATHVQVRKRLLELSVAQALGDGLPCSVSVEKEKTHVRIHPVEAGAGS